MRISEDQRERPSDSPYAALITQGRTARAGATTRPAECEWHMVLTRHNGQVQFLVVGPLTTSGTVHFVPGAEILWIRFALGTFMPHMPATDYRDLERPLPGAAGQSFWLKGSAWQFPSFENADTFIDRLVREEILVHDPLVPAILQGQPHSLSPRTVRQHFLRATGVTQGQVRQVARAKHAAALLRQGCSILDTVEAAGYFDQPHLTRALKHWIGYTPAQLYRPHAPACRSVQDAAPPPGYHGTVLAETR